MPHIPDHIHRQLESYSHSEGCKLRCVQDKQGYPTFENFSPKLGEWKRIGRVVNPDDNSPRSPTERDFQQLIGGDLTKRGTVTRVKEMRAEERKEKLASARHSSNVLEDGAREGEDIIKFYAEKQGGQEAGRKPLLRPREKSGRRTLLIYDHYGNVTYRAE